MEGSADGVGYLFFRGMALGPDGGVLLVAHGTVADLDDLPAFLTQIRRGRPASETLVADLRRRYEAIGGSPLLTTTREVATALERRLSRPVLVGMRFGDAPIDGALREAVARGLGSFRVVPMAPFSVHIYRSAVERVAASLEPASRLDLSYVAPWGTHPGLVAALAEDLRQALAKHGQSAVVMTAHSLPTRVIESGDPYRDQVRACADAVGAALGAEHELAFQSQGADGGDWLGPTVEETFDKLRRAGHRRVTLSPIGFLGDHVETLYDLDIEARAAAEKLGLELVRVRALNADPRLIEVLADLVETSA